MRRRLWMTPVHEVVPGLIRSRVLASALDSAAPKPRHGESYPPSPVSGRAEVGTTQ